MAGRVAAEVEEAQDPVVGTQAQTLLDDPVIGLLAGRPLGGEAQRVRGQQHVLRRGGHGGHLLDLGDLGVGRLQPGGDDDDDRGPGRGGALLVHLLGRGVGRGPAHELGEQLAQLLAAGAAHEQEPPGPQHAVIRGRGACGQDLLQCGVVRPGRPHLERRHGTAGEDGVECVHAGRRSGCDLDSAFLSGFGA